MLTQEEISAMVKRVPLTEDSRREHRERIEGLKEKLREARQGKRDDSDRLAILYRLYMAHFALSEDLTPEARAYRAEGEELLRKHPEFKADFPFDLREEREGRERRRKEQVEKAAGVGERAKKKFRPKDARGQVFWSGKHIAIIYQFRIEFYAVPTGVECLAGPEYPLKDEYQGQLFQPRFRRDRTAVNIMPFKTITFGTRIHSPIVAGCAGSPKSCGIFAISTEQIYPGYTFNDQEEREILTYLREAGRPFRWETAGADFQEFYGVFATDGRELLRIPFKAQPPSQILQALYVTPEGVALFGLGSRIENADDPDYYVFGSITEVISWSAKLGMRREPVAEARQRYPQLRETWMPQ